LPRRLALGEHQRLFLFGGEDLKLFLLFSDLHRQLLGMLAGSLSAAVWLGAYALG
jgi:hypothetical protein